ncbi:hypothetical protein AAFC00_002235 [Neodothiora populina]|uniref:Signal recognition particle subunit SRP68 n=1 Tax=Neodothiora populina TaxID=2781224 RepID=A0ABR3PGR6_9PEZI
MDITSFTIGSRDAALLVGDYNAYRKQLSRQLLAVRKRLGRSTAKGAKYTNKTTVTADDISKNIEDAHLLLLSTERAWAHAMQIKSSHSEDNAGKGITGQTRSHIISRLNKAAKIAASFLDALRDRSVSGATDTDLLEAEAYRAYLSGSEHFEKQAEGQRSKEALAAEGRWDICLRELAVARVIYATLFTATNKDIFREILAGTVDPTIRYAAYQARLPRSVAVSSVALRFFPRDRTELVSLLQSVDANALSEQTSAAAPQNLGTGDIPNTIQWRGRTANIVDASIGQALATVAAAEPKLNSFLSSSSKPATREKAAAYDEVLIASQDAADATRRAIEELEKEGVDEGDARMQDLRVTSLAVNYALVSWRVGRNRALIGSDDGISFEDKKAKRAKRQKVDSEEKAPKEEARGSKLARLRERIVLYDATIQSIESIKELRGAMRDESFVQEIDGKRAYFQALRCLNIAVSHELMSNHANALALVARGFEYATQSLKSIPADAPEVTTAPTLDLTKTQAQELQTKLKYLVYRTQALVDLDKFHDNAAIAASKNMASAAPLVQRLTEYPTPGVNVDLQNLVTYPPKIEPVPVKPLFFDIAWNYIDYPGRAKEEVEQKAQANGGAEVEQPQEDTPKKKGWFGFGR